MKPNHTLTGSKTFNLKFKSTGNTNNESENT